ncbi:hypothetical protein GALMADRAFT_133875 [Galerina marginata CBS 339.88]|uniref:DUF6534 domain-containing protein n=1 Tax=Galerina marginata (strain CBS 339.88) TaxID=685588 RepID=A0A067TN25_GALM3|nr:hypothetical protein GALMADRAFT_133875 [Galerina marginata CBS 339.88]
MDYSTSIPSDIASKTGPRLLGYLFNYGLFGVLSAQVYLYYLAFPKDPARNKAFVYSVFILEILQTLIVSVSAFRVFASGYGDFNVYNEVDLAWLDVPVISGIVAFIAEAFYAYRISILAQSYWVCGIVMLLALVQLGGSIASAVVLKNAVLFSRLLGKRYSISAAIWNGGSALCDVIIAICMTYYLLQRGSNGVSSTNKIVKRVVKLVIETGTVTAAIAIINLVLSVLPSKPSYYQVPSVILAKVYSNSMMAVLNSRVCLGAGDNDNLTSHTFKTGAATRGYGTGQYDLGGGIVTSREVFMSDDRGRHVESSKGYLV